MDSKLTGRLCVNPPIDDFCIHRGWLRIDLFFFVLIASLTAVVSTSFAKIKAAPLEQEAVYSILEALHRYARAHEGGLPNSLADLDEKEVGIPSGFSMDTFIYLAPEGATVDMAGDTPLVIFPLESGAYVGFLRGSVRFKAGGYSSMTPDRRRRSIRGWQIAFIISLFLNAALVLAIFNREENGNAVPIGARPQNKS